MFIYNAGASQNKKKREAKLSNRSTPSKVRCVYPTDRGSEIAVVEAELPKPDKAFTRTI